MVCVAVKLCTNDLRAARGIELCADVELYVSCVSDVCFICFIWMLHVFYLDVAKVDMALYMLQWLYTYIVSVCF
jgi:hypothetical protein